MPPPYWQKRGLIYNADQRLPWARSHAQIPTVAGRHGDALRILFSSRDAQNRSWIARLDVNAAALSEILNVQSEPVLPLGLTGTFDGKSFVETQRRELDFIGDAYAFQTFQHQGRPLGIAWAANWAYVGRGHDFPSCMGFPRRLDWQGELLLPPIEALSALRLEEIAADAPLPPLAELQLRFGAQGFRLEREHPETPVQLTYQDGLLDLTGTWARPRARSVRHTVETAEIHALQIFLDIGLIEISVDGGRLNGTKRLDTDKPFTALRLTAPGAETRIWRLRPAHGKEQAHGHR